MWEFIKEVMGPVAIALLYVVVIELIGGDTDTADIVILCAVASLIMNKEDKD